MVVGMIMDGFQSRVQFPVWTIILRDFILLNNDECIL